MKIAFDAQLLLKDEKTGIGWCAENILQRMPKYQNNLMLYCFTLHYPASRLKDVKKYERWGYGIDECKWFHDVIYKIFSNLLPIPYSFFFRKKADVTVFFNYIVPPGVTGKKVVFVHDMAYKAYPQTVRKRTKDMLNISLKKSCKRADRIVTVSEFSKTEIMSYLGILEEKIVVMPNGVDFSKYHPDYSQNEVNAVKEKYHIKGDYFLYLGTLEPRKNIVRMIQAYAQLKRDKVTLPQLVLAGRKGWLYENIFEIVKELSIEENVIFTGYVGAEEAPVLMKGAISFLFPSIYEGFGMPPLEAMACGTPVLVSNTTSLPEIVGDAGILVDPMSVDSIFEGMKSLLENNDLRDDLSRRGLERVKEFSWDRSAYILENLIKELT